MRHEFPFLRCAQALGHQLGVICVEFQIMLDNFIQQVAAIPIHNFHLFVLENKKRGGETSPPPLNGTATISYLWPECVIRAMMSRRLSSTVEPANSARCAAVHLAFVASTALKCLRTARPRRST